MRLSAPYPAKQRKTFLLRIPPVMLSPLCIKSKDVDEIVNTVYLLSDSFGGVNLEDISAPHCF